jgi:hypothetical protein
LVLTIRSNSQTSEADLKSWLLIGESPEWTCRNSERLVTSGCECVRPQSGDLVIVGGCVGHETELCRLDAESAGLDVDFARSDALPADSESNLPDPMSILSISK